MSMSQVSIANQTVVVDLSQQSQRTPSANPLTASVSAVVEGPLSTLNSVVSSTNRSQSVSCLYPTAQKMFEALNDSLPSQLIRLAIVYSLESQIEILEHAAWNKERLQQNPSTPVETASPHDVEPENDVLYRDALQSSHSVNTNAVCCESTILKMRDEWMSRFAQVNQKNNILKQTILRTFEVLLYRPQNVVLGDHRLFFSNSCQQLKDLRWISLKCAFEELDKYREHIAKFLDVMRRLFTWVGMKKIDEAIFNKLPKESQFQCTQFGIKSDMDSAKSCLYDFQYTSSDEFVKRYLPGASILLSESVSVIPSKDIQARKEERLNELLLLKNRPTSVQIEDPLVISVVDELISCQLKLKAELPLKADYRCGCGCLDIGTLWFIHDKVVDRFRLTDLRQKKSLKEWSTLLCHFRQELDKVLSNLNPINCLPNGIVELEGIPFDFTNIGLPFNFKQVLETHHLAFADKFCSLFDLKMDYMLIQLLEHQSGKLSQTQLCFIRDLACLQATRQGKMLELFRHLPYPQALSMAKLNEEHFKKKCGALLTGRIFPITFVMDELLKTVV